MKKRDLFLQALMNCTTQTEAERVSHISHTSGCRYLRDPAFKAELAAYKAQAMTNATRYLQGNLSKCAAELMEIVNNKSIPAAVRLQAIQCVFTSARNLTETADILTKLAEIEAQIKKGGEEIDD